MAMRDRDITALTIPDRLARHVMKGHPWLYAEALGRPLPPTGSIVRLLDGSGKPFGHGLVDADSPIAVRVLGTRHDPPPGADLYRRRVQAAWGLRARSIDRSQTNAFRALHGEGDRLPGVIADHYAGFLVVKLDTPAWAPHLPDLVAALEEVTHPAGIYLKGSIERRARGGGPSDHGAALAPRVLAGAAPPEDLEIVEHGIRQLVDVYRGQKTGLFLDQRENRRLIRGMARDLEVLNLFCYTGGFSLAALAGGARRATSVDTAREALGAARRNFELNGFDPAAHEFVAEDSVEFLKRCAADRRQFDLVIVDPPSLAPSERALPRAEKAYVRLNERAARQVRPGGFLATASCSSHVSPAAFLAALREAAALARKPLRILEVRQEPADHQTPLHFPEGHYLKFVLAVAD